MQRLRVQRTNNNHMKKESKEQSWLSVNLIGEDEQDKRVTVLFLLFYLLIISIIILSGLWS